MRVEVGRYLVVDSDIHHGEMTFKGTRIPVASVLEDVALGTDWDAIVENWHRSITRDAIAEAIRLASDALVSQSVGVPQRARGKRLSADDSLFAIVGIAASAEGEPTDVSANKHKYLADAYTSHTK